MVAELEMLRIAVNQIHKFHLSDVIKFLQEFKTQNFFLKKRNALFKRSIILRQEECNDSGVGGGEVMMIKQNIKITRTNTVRKREATIRYD